MRSCPKCGSINYHKRGIKDNGNPQFFCTGNSHPDTVSRWWTEKLEEHNNLFNIDKKKAPKILLFDIETSHMIVKTFSLYPESIPHTDIIHDWYMLSFSAKWLYDDEIIEFRLTGQESKERDDYRLSLELWNLLNKADVVIAHNGNDFDIKKANSRFIYYNINPTYDYKQIDTLKMARTYFKFSSNRLDYLGEYLGLGRKISNEKGLWDRCENGEDEALELMKNYCSQDVRLLENIYLKLRPYAKNHPSLSLYGDADGSNCPVCFSENSINFHPSKLYENRYVVGRCNSCGAPVRAKQDLISSIQKKKMVKR